MHNHARRIRRALQLTGTVLVLAACTQSSVRNSDPYGQPGHDQPYPYGQSYPQGQPYYDPYYGGGYGVAYPVWRSDVDVQVDRARTSIERGVEKGNLTRGEAQQLRGELNTILHNADRMQRDGHLSNSERERIRNDLDRLQANIKREKEDDERRRKR